MFFSHSNLVIACILPFEEHHRQTFSTWSREWTLLWRSSQSNPRPCKMVLVWQSAKVKNLKCAQKKTWQCTQKKNLTRVQKKGLPVPTAVGIKRVLGGERGGGDHDADQQEVGNDLRRWSWSWWWGCCQCHCHYIKLTHSSINESMLVIVFLSVIGFVTVVDCICLILGQVSSSLWSEKDDGAMETQK